jgi:hypothetical protein
MSFIAAGRSFLRNFFALCERVGQAASAARACRSASRGPNRGRQRARADLLQLRSGEFDLQAFTEHPPRLQPYAGAISAGR